MSQSTKHTRSRRKPYHHGDLRAALVEAAAALVEEKGLPEVSLREVARRCGVSQAAPYRHFSSREALLAAVAGNGFRAFTQEMADAARGLEDPVSRLKAIAVTYVAFGTTRPETLRLMFGPECVRVDDPELEQAANDAYAMLSDTVAAALERPGAPRLPRPLVTLGIWSLVHGLARLMIDMPGEPPEPVADDPLARAHAVIEIFVDSLFEHRENQTDETIPVGGKTE